MPEKENPAAQQQGDYQHLYSWLRSVETKVTALRREVEIIKGDHAKKIREVDDEIRVLRSDLMEFKHTAEKVQEKIDIIIKELRLTAGKEELEVIKKYLELWNPMKFVTRDDLDRAIDARLSEMKEDAEERAVLPKQRLEL